MKRETDGLSEYDEFILDFIEGVKSMKKLNKLIVFAVSVSILFCSSFFTGFAKDDIVKEHFFVFVKEEYCDCINETIKTIDSKYISEVRELTNPEDYSEPYTPMLLVFVNEDVDSFEKAQKYFQDKEYFLEIRYDVYVGAEDFELSGDVDKDGYITAADARFILRCAVGLEEYKDDVLKIIDIDNDNFVTASDARAVLRLAVGLDA